MPPLQFGVKRPILTLSLGLARQQAAADRVAKTCSTYFVLGSSFFPPGCFPKPPAPTSDMPLSLALALASAGCGPRPAAHGPSALPCCRSPGTPAAALSQHCWPHTCSSGLSPAPAGPGKWQGCTVHAVHWFLQVCMLVPADCSCWGVIKGLGWRGVRVIRGVRHL